MNISLKSLSAVVLVLGCAATFSVQASSGPDLQSIKLLNAQVGWAANSADLYWTLDAGNHWEKRTPPEATPEAIEDVYFLNTSIGWVLLAHGDEDDQVQFDLASTEDAGQTWLVSHVEIPNRVAEDFSGRGSLFFLDLRHGWINLRIISGGAFRPGTMLSTADGGATWSYPAGQPGVAGSFCFFNARDGILSGGPSNTELYVTHDGSTSWQEVSLNASQVLPADFPTYSAPACSGAHGFLPVTYSGREGTKSALVLFETNDAGHVFRPDRVLPDLDETSPGQEIPTALAGSNLVTLGVSNKTILRVTALPRSGIQVNGNSQIGGAPFAVLKASFTDTLQGWALTSFGLLSTPDGGATWRDITPTGPSRATGVDPSIVLEAAESTPSAPETTEEPWRDQSNVSAGAVKNTRLGFDIRLVPTTAQMKTWWQSSPYFESGLYLPGAVNKKPDPNLNASWLTSIIGQGWGLIPIWVGPQAPKGCAVGTPPPTYKGYIITNDPKNTPTMQGQAEARNAINAAKNLSPHLGPIIYVDMEIYDITKTAACSTPVIQYLNGWVSAMRTNHYSAGVYGNPGPAQQDFSRVAPAPDDVWISKTPLGQSPPIVSIWGLKPLCDPFSQNACTPLWSKTSQRIHQFRIDHYEDWGGVTLTVDPNVVDADVAVSSTGAKPYKFKFMQINVPGSTYTTAYGVNNLGDVVGVAEIPTGQQVVNHGFLYSKGTYTLLSYPGADQTYAYSVNDSGQIVGEYATTSGSGNFFLYKNGQYTTIPSSKGYRQMVGINDVGLIVGWYQGTSNNTVSFLDDTNNGVTNLLPVQPAGMDGNAYILGFTPAEAVVVYNPVSKLSTPTPLKQDFHALVRLNNSFLLARGSQLYDITAKAPIAVQPPGATVVTVNDVNDLSQIVGIWGNSAGTHAFLASPQ